MSCIFLAVHLCMCPLFVIVENYWWRGFVNFYNNDPIYVLVADMHNKCFKYSTNWVGTCAQLQWSWEKTSLGTTCDWSTQKMRACSSWGTYSGLTCILILITLILLQCQHESIKCFIFLTVKTNLPGHTRKCDKNTKKKIWLEKLAQPKWKLN